MECQDDRLKTTTESLNNIKMLKLYSWTGTFEKAIQVKRKIEMSVFWKRLTVGMISVSSLYFFPQVLSAVVFSVFIASGHTLYLGMAYTVMTCLNILREPMRYFAYFIGQLIELLVSMERL
jgi:ATP-binding cassette subfamily C (CFTR/MRP) protein 1